MSSISLRPYQSEAVQRIFEEWKERQKTLLVLATGLGKTIVFCQVVKRCADQGLKTLILAHRGELLDQAADKLFKTTGIKADVEKAEQSCLNQYDPSPVVVGSVQTLQNEKRLNLFQPNYFDVIVIDEAHHALSDGYQRILNHFSDAKVLGVTATPDRGDKKGLGKVFDSIAYEYGIAEGIRDGYLSKIKAQTIPLNIDISDVGQSSGDLALGQLGDALDPYLEDIATKMDDYCKDRKTIVFLPLVATSKKFRDILNRKGFHAEEINGTDDPVIRKRKLKDFETGKTNVLCNSMLLTEGFDCPAIDCVICLRPTKVRSLYTQIIGRGTRLSNGKEYLLVLDFLWHTEKFNLCHPASLITDKEEVQKKAQERMEKAADDSLELFDIEDLVVEAEKDVVAEREQKLALELKQNRARKSKFVDPIQWELSINSNDLHEYVETFPWEMKPATDKQKKALEDAGINPDTVDSCGKASLILDKLYKRKKAGLTTPKQIRLLERYGFVKVGEWNFDEASKMINRIAACGWMVPKGIVPETYLPNNDAFKQRSFKQQVAWKGWQS